MRRLLTPGFGFAWVVGGLFLAIYLAWVGGPFGQAGAIAVFVITVGGLDKVSGWIEDHFPKDP